MRGAPAARNVQRLHFNRSAAGTPSVVALKDRQRLPPWFACARALAP